MNKRGFTLIELLAVIVILGIVLVVTIPNIATSINNNKLSALNTLSKEVAKWYDKAVLNDKMSSTKVLGGSIPENTWYCINDVNGKNIANLYGLSSDDIKLDGKAPDENNIRDCETNFSSEKTICRRNNLNCHVSNICSAIRILNGSAEVFLVGKPNGKYSKSNVYSYTLSTNMNGYFSEAE